jgi:hypothetical protein
MICTNLHERVAGRERKGVGGREEGICAAGNPPRPVFRVSFFLSIVLYNNFELTFKWDSDYFSVQKRLCFSYAL